MSHLQIMEEVFAIITSRDHLDYLRMLIEDCLHDFQELYIATSLTPKMHDMVHIPTWIDHYIYMRVSFSVIGVVH